MSVNKDLLKFNPKGKVRIRFSMMPPAIRHILEPNTSNIFIFSVLNLIRNEIFVIVLFRIRELVSFLSLL